MNKCVYLHKDKDGVVRYVGQGNLERPYETSPSKRTKAWSQFFTTKNPPVVEIVKKNLSYDEATKLEVAEIEKYKSTICNIKPPTDPHELSFSVMNEWLYVDETSPSGLRWKKQRFRSKRREGEQAGSLLTKTKNKKYWQVVIFKKVFKAHRLVYLLTHGSIDKNLVIDHIDGNGLNNKVENLRLATFFENYYNSLVTSTENNADIEIRESRRRVYSIFKKDGKTCSFHVRKEDFETLDEAYSAVREMIKEKEVTQID